VALLTLPAVTEKLAAVEPCGIVTDAGTLAPAGDELRLIVAPPLGAAEVSVTVQVEPVAGLTETGLHEKLLKPGRIVMVPPVEEVAMLAPVESASMPLESWTEEDVSVVELDKVSVRVATTPFEMVCEFSPHSTQVAVPAALLQDSDLFAAAGPADNVAEEKSVVE